MIIGLTGGIGSGKSTVASIFGVLGCAVFNSDEVAKEVYNEGTVKAKIIALLGEEAYLPDGTVNRKFIASAIFSDPLLLHKVNSIIHPAVKEKTRQFVESNPDKILVKESALLFEASLDKDVDRIVVVTAPDELRISRVMERDGLTREEVQARIGNQMSQEQKAARAHYTIRNDETEFLIPQCIEILEKCRAKK